MNGGYAMKIEITLGDVKLKYEKPPRPPMSAGRFRALCLLSAAALYVFPVLGIVYLNSAFSAGVIAVITLGALMIFSAIKNGF